VSLGDLFGAWGWVGTATLAYAAQDNAIDFYDTRRSLVSIGISRQFQQPIVSPA
jgi:hypothetical protein